MRIAHLTTVDISLRFLLLPQLKAIVDAGGDAVGISAPGPWIRDLEEAGIRHLPLPASTRRANLLADLRATAQLWQVIRDQRPDVLHTHNPKPGVYGRILGRIAGVPVVVNTVHGLYATEADPVAKRIVVYLLEALATRFSDAELVQNPEDLRLLTRFRISPPARADGWSRVSGPANLLRERHRTPALPPLLRPVDSGRWLGSRSCFGRRHEDSGCVTWRSDGAGWSAPVGSASSICR